MNRTVYCLCIAMDDHRRKRSLGCRMPSLVSSPVPLSSIIKDTPNLPSSSEVQCEVINCNRGEP